MYWKTIFDLCSNINSTECSLKFTKIFGTVFCLCLTVNAWVHLYINIRLPESRASRDSRWLQSSNSTWMFQKSVHFKTRWPLYKCISANAVQIHQQKGDRHTFMCNNFHDEQA